MNFLDHNHSFEEAEAKIMSITLMEGAELLAAMNKAGMDEEAKEELLKMREEILNSPFIQELFEEGGR